MARQSEGILSETKVHLSFRVGTRFRKELQYMVNERQPIWIPPIETRLVTKKVFKRRFLTLFYCWVIALIAALLFGGIGQISLLIRVCFLVTGGILLAGVYLCHLYEKTREVRETTSRRDRFPPVIH
jgi:hypothetical protein